MKIPFNKPFLSGLETDYIKDAVTTGKISGNGKYTKLCHSYFEKKLEVRKCLMTTSCTDALEMAAILLNIKSGDEVILPSYTFVSTANAFELRGAKLVFADSDDVNPNISVKEVEQLITAKTKAIVVVHYAGVSCDMDAIMDLANQHNIFVVEDAAQAIDSFYKNKPLGSIGHLGAFSFHETKNIISGEGGLLTINDTRFTDRAEIIWEKGTNRSAFFRGEVDQYGWVDIGSSFLPSEVISAFLYAQLECLEKIQKKRKAIWDYYYQGLKGELNIQLPHIPEFATNNGSMFYLVCNSLELRNRIIKALKKENILAVFHYLSLHKSPYFESKHGSRVLKNSDRYSDCLLRLPFYYDLEEKDQLRIILIVRKVLKEYANN